MILNCKKIIKGLLVAVVAAVGMPAVAQDKLASMAPIDKKMRAIDSIALKRMNQMEEIFQMSALDLYPTWNNTFGWNYGVELPEEYKIDLRNFSMPAHSRLVTSQFGYRKTFRRNHYGTDIKVFVGDTIYAAFDGKIRIVAYEGKGYGKYVLIRHPNGLETLYGHLSKQLVKEDQEVKSGEPIGLGGNTGRSKGSHLHFETRFLGKYINPEKLFSFEAQDVLADFYVYHSNGQGELRAAHEFSPENLVVDAAAERAALQAKNLESRKFQQEKIASQQGLPRTSVHKVKQGETLSTIARKHGVTIQKLCKLNNIKETSILRIGQILRYS